MPLGSEASLVQVGLLNITIDVEAFTRETQVCLPFARDQAEWSETATLDGLPVQLEWNHDGTGCTISVPEPGRYRLGMSCTPTVEASVDHQGFELSIPPVPNAQLRLSYPPTLERVQIQGLKQLETSGLNKGVLETSVDGLSQLAVNWPLNTPPANIGWQVDELLWLHVSPQEAVLDLRLVFLGTGSIPREVRLNIDQTTEAYRTRRFLGCPGRTDLIGTKANSRPAAAAWID